VYDGSIYCIQVKKIQGIGTSFIAGYRKGIEPCLISCSGKGYWKYRIGGLRRAVGFDPEVRRFVLQTVFEILMEQTAVLTKTDSVRRHI